MISLHGRRFLRTRIAPTPSGYLHLGNLASFVFTAGLARRYGASILLRIDDLDRERVRPAYIEDIFETLQYLDIPWDEGPVDAVDFEQHFSQLLRMDLYRHALSTLAASEAVFGCDCSRSALAENAKDGGYPGTCLYRNLPLDAPGVCWRLKTPDDAVVQLNDLAGGARTFPLPPSMRHFIVRKKDGFPAYQLSSVVDDLHFGVDLVVRGEDLFDSTLAQLYLSGKIGENTFADTCFFHHPLLVDRLGRKLSKSAGDISARYFREQGKGAEELLSAISAAVSLQGKAGSWEDLFQLLCTHWQVRP